MAMESKNTASKNKIKRKKRRRIRKRTKPRRKNPNWQTKASKKSTWRITLTKLSRLRDVMKSVPMDLHLEYLKIIKINKITIEISLLSKKN
jgi:hypothetical protein